MKRDCVVGPAGLLAVTFSLLSIRPVFAEAELSVSAQVDKSQVKQGEPLVFQIHIAGPIRQAPKVQIDSIEGFAVVSTGQSQQIQMRGGEIQQTLAFVYTLVPTQAGDRTLGPVKVEVQGKSYETQPIQVKVLPGPARPAPKSEKSAPRPPKLEGEVIL